MPEPYRAPEKPVSDEQAALMVAQCDYLARCDPDALHLFARSSKEACQDYFACQAGHGFAVRPDTNLTVCIESLNSRPCPDVDTMPLERFSYGGGLLGGVFPWGPECGAPDLSKLLAAPPDAPREGEPCLGGSEVHACQGNNYCALTDIALTAGLTSCGICAAQVPLGQACGRSDICAAGASCVLGQCAQRLPVGAPCTAAEQCRFSICENGVCGSSKNVLEPYASVLDRPCQNDTGCGNQAGLQCIDGLCRSLLDEGDRCDPFKGGCRLGESCVAGRCAVLGCTLDLGEACAWRCSVSDCRDGVCAPPGTRIGDPCDAICANGLECVHSRCAAPPDRSLGTACDFDENCATRFCQRDLSAYCSKGSCLIPACDKCGVCAALPTVSMCK